MSRHDLIDFESRVIKPLLPNKARGVPRVDDRRVLNGIFWRITLTVHQTQRDDEIGNDGAAQLSALPRFPR